MYTLYVILKLIRLNITSRCYLWLIGCYVCNGTLDKDSFTNSNLYNRR